MADYALKEDPNADVVAWTARYNTCPECTEPALRQLCQHCTNDRFCVNGHDWHFCHYCKSRVKGEGPINPSHNCKERLEEELAFVDGQRAMYQEKLAALNKESASPPASEISTG